LGRGSAAPGSRSDSGALLYRAEKAPFFPSPVRGRRCGRARTALSVLPSAKRSFRALQAAAAALL